VLDTHDGIGMLDAGPDRDERPGLLTAEEIRAVVEEIRAQTAARASRPPQHREQSRRRSDQLHVLRRARRQRHEHLVARAIPCFRPGSPHVYYVGLLAGRNDMTLLARTGVATSTVITSRRTKCSSSSAGPSSLDA
jgi:sucrose phosphorylase